MRALLFLAAALLAAAPAWAQTIGKDYPDVPSPLTIASDPNGVNLTTGKIAIDVPVLSTPAAPNLRFDRLQNAAPRMDGKGNTQIGNYSVHTGAGPSEAFYCNPDVAPCESRTRSGSTFNKLVYIQAGSGAHYLFDNVHVNTLNAPGGGKLVKYVSNIRYPNGEEISYGYETGSGSGLTWFRPSRIVSSMGYEIRLSYEGGNLAVGDFGTLRQAALYRWATVPVLIRRLVYSGTTITDYGDNPADSGGRQFACTGCNRAMGSQIEATSGSLRLPDEGADTLQILPSTQQGVTPGWGIVGSVIRDGVAWNYSYGSLSLYASTGTYWYNSVTVTGPNGYNELYTMVISDRRPVLTGVRNSLGDTVSYQYDESYRPVRITQPEGNSVALAYGENGAVTSRTTTSKTGQTIIERLGYAVACPPHEATPRCYRPDWSTDGLGRQTDFAYNARGQMIEQTGPADQHGVRTRTTISYDESTGLSRKSAVRICGLGSTCGTNREILTEYQYWGNTLLPTLERRIDSHYGRIRDTRFTYDPAGRLLSTDGPLAGPDDATYSRYDVHGRKTWEIGARSAEGLRIATRFAYRDSDDRVLYSETGTLPDASSEALSVFSRSDFTYDRRNPVRQAVSKGGVVHKVTDQSWDLRDRLVCTAIRMNPDSFGQMPGACAHTTPGSQGPDRISWNHYDAAGQLTSVEKAVNTPFRQDYAKYEYTDNGQRSAVTDANGNRAEMGYDGFDRQTRWTFPSSTPGYANPADYEQYGYDPVGNRTSLRKRDGSTLTYQYDNLNRVIRKTVPERFGLTAAQTRDVLYDYDAMGLQTKARFDALDGYGVTTWYDAFGQPVTALLNMAGESRYVSYWHDEAGDRVRITHPDGAAFGYAYDPLGRTTAVHDNPAPAVLDDYVVRYWYKPEGPRHAAVRGAGSAGFTTIAYYDALLRPEGIHNDLPAAGADLSFSFAYNAASQIVSRTVSNDSYAAPPADDVARGYQVNGLNQYTGTTWAGAPTWSFEHDPNGNLKRSIDPAGTRTTSFVYDVENRLVSASGYANATLVYDPLGRLFEVSSPTGSTARFLYDGDRMIAEYDGAGTLLKRYVHGPGADEPVAVYYGPGPTLGTAGRRYMLPDERGSIVALVDSDGTPAVRNRYDPWGVPPMSSAGSTNEGRFQYTGQAWIAELGLYYYKARLYSPWLGRFMQTDPIGYEDGMNLYGYVGNDPVNRRDPSGLAQCRGDSRCGEVHAAAAEARAAARSASADLRNLASALKKGDGLSADQEALLATFEKKFGNSSGNVATLNRVAGRVDGISARIGAEGFGAQIRFSSKTGPAEAIARGELGRNVITLGPKFFGEDGGAGGVSQASVLFHEGGHMFGLRDRPSPVGTGREGSKGWLAYGMSAADWLGANDPAGARRNNDNYNCFVIVSCGGP